MDDPGTPVTSSGSLGHTLMLNTHYLVLPSAFTGLGKSQTRDQCTAKKSAPLSCPSSTMG